MISICGMLATTVSIQVILRESVPLQPPSASADVVRKDNDVGVVVFVCRCRRRRSLLLDLKLGPNTIAWESTQIDAWLAAREAEQKSSGA
jgi:hypothetical protein